MSEKIKCELCGEEVHVMKKHLEEKHDGMSVAEYQRQFPDAPLLSPVAIKKLEQMKKRETSDMAKDTTQPLHELFNIPASTKKAMSAKGKPIPIRIMGEPTGPDADFLQKLIPAVDENYIFNIDSLKMALLGIENNMNVFVSGHAGTGKTTLFDQVCARTRRPVMRIQHTGNTEESHIVGQYVVKDGETVWEPGPLQIAMKLGIAFLADEYDRGLPPVLSVYQPVLEGKPLLTKEAPDPWRIIEPHPNFRFMATGNTNGAGDDTGLFPSTALQDFANFERFGIMLRISWLPEKQEIGAIVGQAKILEEDAKPLVKFATEVRKMVDSHQISAPISTRALINAAKIGVMLQDYNIGLQVSFINRLGAADAEACRQVAQRHFG